MAAGAFFAAGFLLLWYHHGTIAVIAYDAIARSGVADDRREDAIVRFSPDLPRAVSHEEFKEKNGSHPPDMLSASSSKTLVNIMEGAGAGGGTTSPRPPTTPTGTPTPPTPKPSPTPRGSIPPTMNLDVPFTSQAPFENWDLPFKEACEEASLLMVDGFYKGGRFTKQSATDAIMAVVNFERSRLGSDQDTNAEQTAIIAREYFGYQNVRVRYGPFTADDLKKELAAGHPLIAPMAGRLLGNPYFRRPGPYYHMLVIKGYTPTGFITNDPGTKRGADYEYSYATVLNAMHDFDPVSITTMPQAMIVVHPN